MNGRDGRYDSGDMNDADWLLSQLGSGRRPDLEGRQAPPQPVAPAPHQPVEPVSQPPMERPRRRSEESLEWFSLADGQAESDAATRALPVVGEPYQRREEPQRPPAPAWEPQAPAWNQPPAWDDRRPPVPPRGDAHDRLTSVEPPVGAPVPPAFGGPAAPPPGPPPGPVTPPANFALTWGEQKPLDTEDDLRAAFRRLSDPSESGPPATLPGDGGHGVDPRRGDAPPAPTAAGDSPFAAFTPPAARESFTPAAPPAGAAFPPARTNFDDELWSALHEDASRPETASLEWEHDDDGRGYSEEQAYADASGQQGLYGDDRGFSPDWYADDSQFRGDAAAAPAAADAPFDPRLFDQRGFEEQRGYDDRGYDGQDQRGYDDRGYDGQDQRGYDDRGYDGQDQRGYDQRGYDDRGYEEQRAYDERGYDERSGSGDFRAEAQPERGRERHDESDWYADLGGRDDGADDSRAGTPGGQREGLDLDARDGSPMARELAQTGYFWNLTPDPTAPDPKAPRDDEPGPRRRGAGDEGPGTGRSGSGDRYDRGTADPAAFGEDRVPVRDDRDVSWGPVPSEDAFDERHPGDLRDPGYDAEDDIDDARGDDRSGRAGDRDAAYGPADAYGAADPSDRDGGYDRDGAYDGDAAYDRDADDRDGAYRRDDAYGSADARGGADGHDDDWFAQVGARGGSYGPGEEWEDDPRRDARDRSEHRDDRARGFAHDDRDRPGAEDDGLASLFGGAGFGATAPTPLVGGAAAARGREADPFGGLGDDRYDDRADRYANGGRYDREGGYDRGDRYGRGDDDRSGRGGSTPVRAAGHDDDDRGGRSPVKLLAWIAGGLAAVLLVVAGVAFGAQLLGGGGGSADAGSEAAPEPTAMQPPGTYAWNELYGGECIDPFENVWAQEFTVIDCTTPHAAQLVLRGEVSTDEAAPFPGEAEVAAQVKELCGAENVINPEMAAMAGDLQVEGSYPATEEQWNAGERTFYCFVTRGGGTQITADVQGTAGQQG